MQNCNFLTTVKLALADLPLGLLSSHLQQIFHPVIKFHFGSPPSPDHFALATGWSSETNVTVVGIHKVYTIKILPEDLSWISYQYTSVLLNYKILCSQKSCSRHVLYTYHLQAFLQVLDQRKQHLHL